MTPEIDPPRDAAAEERLLACMMSGVFAADDALKAGVVADDFTSMARRFVFEAIQALRLNSTFPELVLIHDVLVRAGQSDRAGGPLELTRLADLVPSGASVLHYAKIVTGHGRRRRLMRAAERLYRRAADLTVPDDEVRFTEEDDP